MGNDGKTGSIDEMAPRTTTPVIPDARWYADQAKASAKAGDPLSAARWALEVTTAHPDFSAWLAAAAIYRRATPTLVAKGRSARIAVLGSYTTSQYATFLPLACAKGGIMASVHEGRYGQYQQELIDPPASLRDFAPDTIVLAVHAGEAHLPLMASDPATEIESEVRRWTSLWERAAGLGARVIQHNFAIPAEVSVGHLGARTPGSRYAMLQVVNRRLGEEAAAHNVLILDCEHLSGVAGKTIWFDARYYHLAKQAVSLASLPLLALHTAAVLAGDMGLARKCLVLDLDNTLWGGVVGEVGVNGVEIGEGPAGEAYAAFQAYALELKQRGVVLAVCSKNNDIDARQVFDTHPGMVIKRDDIAMFAASWDDKPTAIKGIASALNIGLDSLVFVDDNPAEREAVRQLVPDVDLIPLPTDPAGYVQALATYPFFETSSLTTEDATRTAQYRARAESAAVEQTSATIEEFYASLDMAATVTELDDSNAGRVAQLIGKTNQFNLTVRRRNLAEVTALINAPNCISLVVRLQDRFADHGIIGVIIGLQRDTVVKIDTWLMSCRVIGRTVESAMLAVLAVAARKHGADTVEGLYVAGEKNALVAELYPKLGFTLVSGDANRSTWRISVEDIPPASFITVQVADARGAA